jgi:tRNA(adenine34) deaminase
VAKLFARGNKHMSNAETQAYNSPFKDRGHRAALHAFPPMVPEFENSPGAEISRQALHFWREQWQGQTMMAIGLQDPVLGEPVMRELQQNIKGCPPPLLLSQAGHLCKNMANRLLNPPYSISKLVPHESHLHLFSLQCSA